MKKPVWIETKQECEVNEDGNLVVKKVTRELQKEKVLGLERKDLIDTILRFIGLISIALPIVLFYFQQNAENRKQKALLQNDLYSNIAIHLHQLMNKNLSKTEFDSIKDKVLFEYYPKMALYTNDSSVINLLDKINFNISHYSDVSAFIAQRDTLYIDMGDEVFSELLIYKFQEPIDIQLVEKDLEKFKDKWKELNNSLLQNRFETALKSVEDNRFETDDRMSDKHFSKLFYPMDKLDKQIVGNLNDIYILHKDIKSYRGNGKLTNNNKFKKEIGNKAGKIYDRYIELANTLIELNALKKQYHKYINELVKKLNMKLIQSNRILTGN